MRLYCVFFLWLAALAGCIEDTDSLEPAGRAAPERTPEVAATSGGPSFKKVLVPIPPPDGGPYDTCGVSLCVEGYVDIHIAIDPSCPDGYRTFCVPCGGYPLPWCR